MMVRDTIQQHYTEYLGDASFLCPISPRTQILLDKVKELLKQEW